MNTGHRQQDPIVVRLAGGRRVDAQVRGHTVHTDQPVELGGEDTAASPFELFLVSLGACAGVFVEAFCANRSISTEGIEIIERASFGDDGVLAAVGLELRLPAHFPDRYRGAILKVVEQCTVKRAIAASPVIRVVVAPAVVQPEKEATTR